jgi:hypothetical protein
VRKEAVAHNPVTGGKAASTEGAAVARAEKTRKRSIPGR